MKTLQRQSAALLIVIAAGLACVHQNQLVPAPGAQTEPGRPRTVDQIVSAVRVQVDSNAWRWGTVSSVLSPVQLTIENGSRRPLRIAYNEITLGAPSGFRLAALPPFQVAAANPTPVQPQFYYSGFFVAPWYGGYYPGFSVWGGPFPYDAPYYDAYYGGWPATLPDQDVLQRALPEGVLQPGGRVTGFLYFPDQPKGTQLSFLMTLVDAGTGQVFGTVEIPFLVK